jgi:hypothetical protein
MDIDFYSRYININFDEILTENNNLLVNSEEMYLKYKKKYFDETHTNYKLFKDFSTELKILENDQGYTNNNNRYLYVYKDITKIEELRLNIKNIVIAQNTLFYNFNHYINLLNSKQELFINNKQNKRSILSRLFTS